MSALAPSLHAGTHLHQVVPVPNVPVDDGCYGNGKSKTIPIPIVPVAKWKVLAVGDKWGAFQPWAGEVYWLRLFDTFQLAKDFVRMATARAAIHK